MWMWKVYIKKNFKTFMGFYVSKYKVCVCVFARRDRDGGDGEV